VKVKVLMKKGQSAKEKKWKRATGVGPLGLGAWDRWGICLGISNTETYRIAIKGSEKREGETRAGTNEIAGGPG
jgi:hypothetical protein